MSDDIPFVALLKNPNGTYVAPCRIGTATFPAKCDTGANVCIITREVARNAGLSERDINRLPSDHFSAGAGAANVPAKVAHLDWWIGEKLFARGIETWIVNGTRCLIGDTLITHFEMIKTYRHEVRNEVMFLSER